LNPFSVLDRLIYPQSDSNFVHELLKTILRRIPGLPAVSLSHAHAFRDHAGLPWTSPAMASKALSRQVTQWIRDEASLYLRSIDKKLFKKLLKKL
jgi:hypothetical protein